MRVIRTKTIAQGRLNKRSWFAHHGGYYKVGFRNFPRLVRGVKVGLKPAHTWWYK